MADAQSPGRSNQKRRTRKALLEAAWRLMQEGKRPTLDDVAEAALVSRATAYRYFAGTEALLVEAALDVAMPGPEMFANDASRDAVDRLRRADTAVHDMVLANEPGLRAMLAESLRRGPDDLPARQNRRSPLIDAALDASADQFTPGARDRLAKALALVIGTEAMIVCKDVLQLDDAEARAVKAWAIEALVDAARRERLPTR